MLLHYLGKLKNQKIALCMHVKRLKRDASTNYSNNSGVSRKRFKPSTPESTVYRHHTLIGPGPTTSVMFYRQLAPAKTGTRNPRHIGQFLVSDVWYQKLVQETGQCVISFRPASVVVYCGIATCLCRPIGGQSLWSSMPLTRCCLFTTSVATYSDKRFRCQPHESLFRAL